MPSVSKGGMLGVLSSTVSFTEATGGSVTTDGDYKIHTFNSSGTFTITTLGSDGIVDILNIAGGGGGGGSTGAYSGAGGGGAGGYIKQTGRTVIEKAYTITIGAGGSGGGAGANKGANGGDTTFSTELTSKGGGGGDTGSSSASGGVNGGSGGGGSYNDQVGGSQTQTGQSGD